MSESRIGAVVLAAGESARMGEPKQSLRFEGETLLRRAALAALGSSCRPVVVVLGANAEELKKEIGSTGVRVVFNEEWAEGMSSSIRCGLRALGEPESSDASAGEFEVDEVNAVEVEAAVFLLCDQPLVTSETIERIVRAYRRTRAPLVVSEYEAGGEKTRGVPALFGRQLFAELMQLRGAEGAKRVIRRHAAGAEFVAAPEAAFDVDTPDDYRALRDAAARFGEA
ncbi:MAG TPA: nucleotidyltransferase family protein [Pyrinomonadaceae bacterium]|nr:nucleotidyltransferase family protein [Pyrinomonadaceae bacterium]